MLSAILLGRAVARAWRPRALASLLAAALLVLWLLCQLFGALPASTRAFPSPSYWAFLAPALAVASALPGALLAGQRLLSDRAAGRLERLLVSAAWPGALALAESGAAASQALLLVPTLLLVSAGAGLDAGDPVLALLGVVALSTLLALCYGGLSAGLALLSLDRRILALGCGALLAASVVCSDLLLPAALLPGWLTWLAQINPLSIAVDEARRLFGPRPAAGDYLYAALVLGAVALLTNGAAATLLARHQERALAPRR